MHRLIPAGPSLGEQDLRALYATPPGTAVLRANFAATLDGASTIGGRSAGIGGPGDRRLLGLIRSLADAIMVGAGTLRDEAYGPVRPAADRAAWRASMGLAPAPRLVVVSGRLDLDPALPALANAPVRPIVITHGGSDPARRRSLQHVADVLVHGDHAVGLGAAITALRGAYGLHHLVCEGGPALFGALCAADLIDEVCLTVAPLLAGPGAGRIVAGPAGAAARTMTLAHVLATDDRLLLRYVRPS